MGTLQGELLKIVRRMTPADPRLGGGPGPTVNNLIIPESKPPTAPADPDTPYDPSGGYTG